MRARIAGLIVTMCSFHALAGPLAPPGAPAPTMKTLQEVEPRTPISQADVPLQILLPGSYYLTENLLAVGLPANHVIEIASDNVTLDLRGFTITGSSEVAQAFDGVKVFDGIRSVAIRNGTIEKCIDRGIDAEKANDIIVEGIRAIGNIGDGIVIASGIVRECVATNNSGSGIVADTIVTGRSTTIVDCVSTGNGFLGIDTGFGCSIQNCVVRDSGTIGIQTGSSNTIMNTSVYNSGADGFSVGAGSSITNCASSSNGDDGYFVAGGCQVTGSTAYKNTGDGFTTNFNASFIGNNAYLNGVHGITLASACVAIENTCNGNGVSVAGGAGIFVGGGSNHIEGNHFGANDIGLSVTVSNNNLIIRNSAQGNGTEYNVLGGNSMGPIVTSANIAANTNPSANYDH
jgi:parallel beta helix pectate lyase-like protein